MKKTLFLITDYFILVLYSPQTTGAKLINKMQKTASGLEYTQINSTTTPEKAIIFLHGLGADYQDFAFLPDFLSQNTNKSWAVVLPNATSMPITVNNGYKMRAWYDIYSMDITNKDDKDGVAQSVADIISIIESLEEQGVDSTDIFLGGFSQGGVISLSTINCYPKKLAGIIALSTYLPISTIIKSSVKTKNIFMAHGISDPVINIKYAQDSKQRLEVKNYNITWNEYDMEHTIIQKELNNLISWLNQHI
jgi:phospholipase/carboxylesterase